MSFFTMLIKFYLVVIIFRNVMTRQELYFNPLGKLVAGMTDPIFEKMLKITKKTADRLTFVFVLIGIALNGLIITVFSGMGVLESFLYSASNMLTFLMVFYIVCVILGVFAGSSQMSYYAIFFNRLASFWVSSVRRIIPVKSNVIVIPAIIFVFVFFTVVNGLLTYAMQTVSPITSSYASIEAALLISVKDGFMSMIGLLDIYIWIIIIRSLMSWVSPDPRNPIVQLLHSVTDPVMEPFRKVIPPLGPVDISPMVLIFLLYFLKMMLVRMIGILL